MRAWTGILCCAAALAAAAPRAGAQGVNKCVDARGRITYTSQPCENLGQKSGGEVRDTMNTVPGYQPPARQEAPRAPAKPPAEGDAAASAKGEASVGKPPADAGSAGAGADVADPNKRCFTVKTAKGVATRCNDRPSDDDTSGTATPSQ